MKIDLEEKDKQLLNLHNSVSKGEEMVKILNSKMESLSNRLRESEAEIENQRECNVQARFEFNQLS